MVQDDALNPPINFTKCAKKVVVLKETGFDDTLLTAS